MSSKQFPIGKPFFRVLKLGAGRKHLPRALALLACLGIAPLAHAEDLKQALALAYQNSPRLQAEQARLRELDENYVQAQALGRANIGLGASIARSGSKLDILTGGNSLNSTSYWATPTTGQLSIEQPLYQGGRVKGLKRQAKSGVLAARENLRAIEQSILLAAANAYLDVVLDEEVARLQRTNVSVLMRQEEAAQARFDVGVGTKTDIAQARARLANADIGLASADARLQASRARYVRYMGAPPLALQSPPPLTLPNNLIDAQATALGNNPQIMAARLSEETAQAAISVARSAHRPTVSLNGSLQSARETNASVPRSDSAAITAQIRVPLFAGGGNKSKVRAARAALTRSRFETREAEQASDQNVSSLWAQLQAARRVYQSRTQQIGSAKIALEGVELEQQVGTRSTLDVLNAQAELLGAQIGVAQAKRDVSAANYQLLSVLGGFDAVSLALPVVRYDPDRNFNEVSQSPYQNWTPEVLKPITRSIGGGAKKIGKTIGSVLPRD